MHLLNLTDKVVLITGGTKGVGKGIAQSFLAQGANVLVCARTEPDVLPNVNGVSAEFYSVDVRDLDALNQLFTTIEEKYKQLDVLVNNAGGAPFALAAEASPRFSDKIMQLNFHAPLNMSQAANRIMQKQADGGCIINIASVSGQRPSPGTAVYGAAKAALMNVSQSLAVEWGPKVRINCIAAGPILTEQAHLHFGDDAGVAAVAKTIPLQRMANPEDIGNLSVMLASNFASYLSGACLTAHGGGERPAFLDAANANNE